MLAVGYRMGGPIASILARDHPTLVAGLVLGATSLDWSTPRMKTFWRTMAALRLVLGLAPEKAWQRGLRAGGFPTRRSPRGSPPSSAAATRSTSPRPAASSAATTRPPGSPASSAPRAILVTTKDTAVPPSRQRALAAALRAPVFEVHGDHGAVIVRADEFNAQLLAALDAVRDPRAAATA